MPQTRWANLETVIRDEEARNIAEESKRSADAMRGESCDRPEEKGLSHLCSREERRATFDPRT